MLQIGSQVSLETLSFGAKSKELKGTGIWKEENEKAMEAKEALRGYKESVSEQSVTSEILL